jgi:hypothetical protein
MSKFIHIRSSKFPILPGEREELVNEGMFGKALAEYVRLNLIKLGYDAPFVCSEDWGWWVEIKGAPSAFGACIYSGPEESGPIEFACSDGAASVKKWSWRQFKFIDVTPWIEKLHDDLIAIFRADNEIEVVCVSDDLPDLCSVPTGG